MDPGSLAIIGAVVGPIVGVGTVTFFGLMCFPSVRAAVVERLRQRTLRHGEAADVAAQLAALRGEVYALRSELAKATQALESGSTSNQLGSGSNQGRITS